MPRKVAPSASLLLLTSLLHSAMYTIETDSLAANWVLSRSKDLQRFFLTHFRRYENVAS
jgi:hypothetical protein